MRPFDTFRMAAGGLRERKMRTALTILGIVIGSSMIVALFASTAGQTAAIEEQLGRLGPNTLIARSLPPNRFDSSHLDRVLEDERVELAFLSVYGNMQVTRAGITGPASVVGIDPDDLPELVRDLRLVEGEVFAEGQLTAAFLGYTVAAPDPANNSYVYTGDFVTLSSTFFQPGLGAQTTSRTLQASGIAAEFGSTPFIDIDRTVFVPLPVAQELLRLNPSQYNQIIILARDSAEVAALQADLPAILGVNAQILSGTQLAATISGVYESIGRLLTSIAAISLIVAGVGIANTMFVSVLERVTEIGTLKSLGFKAREVLSIFLLEASLTGLLGGLIGCVFGVGVAFAIGEVLDSSTSGAAPAPTTAPPTGGIRTPGGGGGGAVVGPGGGGGAAATPSASTISIDSSPVFSPELFLTALAFAVGIALLAGLIPSRKAAKLDPVIALKRL